MEEEKSGILVCLNREGYFRYDVLIDSKIEITEPNFIGLIRRVYDEGLFFRTKIQLYALRRSRHFYSLFHIKLVLYTLEASQNYQTVLFDINDCLEFSLDQAIFDSADFLMKISFRLQNGWPISILILDYNWLKLLILIKRVCFLHIADLYSNLMCIVNQIRPGKRNLGAGFYYKGFVVLINFNIFVSCIMNVNRKLIV